MYTDQRDRCTTHNSAVKKVKVTSKKWRWKPGQQKYGWMASKETKFICTGRGLEIPGRATDDVNDMCIAVQQGPSAKTSLGHSSHVARGSGGIRGEKGKFSGRFDGDV